MRFTCENCSKELNIADDKLPEASRFKVKCPHCQEETIVDRKKQKKGKKSPKGLTSTTSLGEIEPEIFPPGAKVIFVHISDNEWLKEVERFFVKAGYHESLAQSTDEAVLKLRLNDYDVLLIEDTLENSMLMEEIASWTGLKRRLVNVVLMTNKGTSMDPMLAFRKGVNFIINEADLKRGAEFFTNALNGYVEYYRWLVAADHREAQGN
ncbi:MAG: hypothetical protein D6E12_01100 [Desulfovibrio sp.]|nr:MAG: hypothetical protein D6E12_01100 [Desulfovibrio sp.]